MGERDLYDKLLELENCNFEILNGDNSKRVIELKTGLLDEITKDDDFDESIKLKSILETDFKNLNSGILSNDDFLRIESGIVNDILSSYDSTYLRIRNNLDDLATSHNFNNFFKLSCPENLSLIKDNNFFLNFLFLFGEKYSDNKISVNMYHFLKYLFDDSRGDLKLNIFELEVFFKLCCELFWKIENNKFRNDFFFDFMSNHVLDFCVDKGITIRGLNDFLKLYLKSQKNCEPVSFLADLSLFLDSKFKKIKKISYIEQVNLVRDLITSCSYLTLNIFIKFDVINFNPIHSGSIFKKFKSGVKRVFFRNSSLSGELDKIYLSKNKKNIIKVYSKEKFMCWQKAYTIDWKSFDFDYIPIEPVLKVFDYKKANIILKRLDESNEISALNKNQVLIYTKIVGISISDLVKFFPSEYILHKERIHKFANDVNNLLFSEGINHNDFAYDNLCIDLKTKRLYVIDFGLSKLFFVDDDFLKYLN